MGFLGAMISVIKDTKRDAKNKGNNGNRKTEGESYIDKLPLILDEHAMFGMPSVKYDPIHGYIDYSTMYLEDFGREVSFAEMFEKNLAAEEDFKDEPYYQAYIYQQGEEFQKARHKHLVEEDNLMDRSLYGLPAVKYSPINGYVNYSTTFDPKTEERISWEELIRRYPDKEIHIKDTPRYKAYLYQKSKEFQESKHKYTVNGQRV